MAQYREIEDLCFMHFSRKYGQKYSFMRDIRMGKYDYDLIGVSRKSDIDLLVEIKYWRNPAVVARGLIDACRQLNDACGNYQTIAHRNSSGIVFIVASDERLTEIKNAVDRQIMRALSGNCNKIVVRCISEDVIKQ